MAIWNESRKSYPGFFVDPMNLKENKENKENKETLFEQILRRHANASLYESILPKSLEQLDEEKKQEKEYNWTTLVPCDGNTYTAPKTHENGLAIVDDQPATSAVIDIPGVYYNGNSITNSYVSTSVLSFNNPEGKETVRIENDGTVTVSEEVTLDEASATFWEQVMGDNPIALREKINRLEETIQELKLHKSVSAGFSEAEILPNKESPEDAYDRAMKLIK